MTSTATPFDATPSEPTPDTAVSLSIQCLCIDASDPQAIAGFWEEALGWRRTYDTQDGVAPDLLFLRVPDGKVVKNRLHLDLRPQEQAVEVARLEALGARRTDVGQAADARWVVLADPEGNEFCVLRAFAPDELAGSE
jgi:glyoxalase superfamily protein